MIVIYQYDMEGLINREQFKYITVYKGKFAIASREGVEGAVMRVNKLGRTVWEIYYPEFVGTLVEVQERESKEYGNQWGFKMIANDEKYIIQMSNDSGILKTFLKVLPNINITKKLTLQPSIKEVDGKKKTSLFISQDGVTLKHAFTRERPNGIPDMVQVTVRGNLMWDDTLQLDFLRASTEAINKKLIEMYPSSVTQATTKVSEPNSEVTMEEVLNAKEDDDF